MASSLWAGGTNTTEGPDNSRISTKGTGFAGIGGTGGASMIVFGTIAGGAGAALTGGNFWKSALTGLIVTGLNDLMHPDPNKAQARKFNREFNKKYGNVANKPAPATKQTVVNMVNDIPTLKNLSNSSKKPDLRVVHTKTGKSSSGAEAHYFTNAEGTFQGTDASSGHFINFYDDSFKTYRNVAENALHQLSHAYNRTHGVFLSYFNESKGSVESKWNRAVNLDEVNVYEWVYDNYNINMSSGYSEALRKLGR